MWISLDELLEKVMLKLYKQWERPALGQVRLLLDDERLRLSNALRTLASSNVAQSEDAMILYLERLSTLQTVADVAQEELDLLADVKNAILRGRRPSMRLRGRRAKPTNLTPARLQVLFSLLEALDPPTYAVSRMYFPEDLEQLAALLEAALVMVFDAWEELALETRGAVLRILHTVEVGLVEDDGRYLVTLRSVVETLHQFEAMPEIMRVSRDAFLAGKLDTPGDSPYRYNAMAVISERLAAMIGDPPPIVPDAAPDEAVSPVPTPAPEQPVAPPVVEPRPDEPVAEQPATPDTPDAPVEAPPAPPVPVQPVQPAIWPAPPPAPAVERTFHTDVRFSKRVRSGDAVPLIVRLARTPFSQSLADGSVNLAFAQPDQPEYVEVVLVAHGFSEVTNSWSRTIAVYPDRDSQSALFLLTAQAEPGEKRVSVDFYHKGRYLGSVAFTTQIVEQATGAPPGVTVPEPVLRARFVAQPPPPADLELRITRGERDNVLQFMLHSARAGVGYHWRPMGEVRLNTATPQAYLETLFAHLSRLAGRAVDYLQESDALLGAEDIAAIGEQLFRDLFPSELQTEFWARILPRRRTADNPSGQISSLLITSDEPWIPWEMVKPVRVDPVTGRNQSAGFLAETFQVARWLAGRSPGDHLHVRRVGLVAPGHETTFAQREEVYFRQLPARRVEVAGPLRTAEELCALARSGGVQLLHLAGHGRYDGDNADLSPLSLRDGTFTPFDLMGERAAGLRQDRPLIFLNACHTARLAFTLTGLAGWAERLVRDIGAGAFVGTLWEVNDLLAAEFAITFYDRLLAGETLGQAFYAARIQVRDRQPANPTWLAYVLYGDPNSVVFWGSDETEEAAPAQVPAPKPEVPPAPAFDPAQFRLSLESNLSDLLTDLVRRAVSPAVEQALARANGELDETPLVPREEAPVSATDVAESRPTPDAADVADRYRNGDLRDEA